MENILLDKITENEYNILTRYRDWYAWNNEVAPECTIIPIKSVLQEWARVKGNLFTLLGENLIISKEFSFEKSEDELYSEMYDMIENHGVYGRSNREGWRFIQAFNEWYTSQFPLHDSYLWTDSLQLTPEQREQNRVNVEIRNGLRELVSISCLVHNAYEQESFSITLPNGKDYTVQTGCKPMKALTKIVNAFDIPYFEDFRICHSLVHNQKRLKGELVLSIHPLDYWTMSDNESGWDSCMNWQDNGGYRQGTVEMMNSPSVVVAYLNAEDPMWIGDMEWSNKKWRQLYIVDKDVILGIKDYPYHNEELSISVIKWIKELAEKNLGWKYLNNEPIKYRRGDSYSNPLYPDEKDFKFYFCSNHMYTDVGGLKWHPMYIGEEVHEKALPLQQNQGWGYTEPTYTYNYSGAAECVSCGLLNPEFVDDSYVCCHECEDSCFCSECGELINNGEEYVLRNVYLCESCWDDLTMDCPCCGNRDFSDNFTYISFLPRLDEKTMKEVNDYKGELPSIWTEQGYTHAFPGMEVCLCDDCYTNFANEYLKPDGELFTYKNSYGTISYGCYIDDLNEKGLDEFMNWRFLESLRAGSDKIDLIKEYLDEYYMMIKISPLG